VTGPLPPVVAHAYISTACQHNLHQHCGSRYTLAGGSKTPAVCKYCETRCLCPKHTDESADCIGAILAAIWLPDEGTHLETR